jgi:O-antigen/teichoic acid export membrane protein
MALSAALPLVGMNMIVGSALNAKDRQRQWALTGVAAAILNPALNLLAIPYTQTTFGNGAIGAAAVTSCTEIFMFIVGQFLLPRGVLTWQTATGVLKCMMVGLVMAAVVWTARGLPILLTISLGAVVYAAGSLLVGTVSIHDLARVRTHLVSRRAPATVPA